MPHILTTLDNGLTVVSDTMPDIPSVSLTIGVDVGSRYENSSQNGTSHFLEHLAFKGTERRTAKQIAEEFDAIGGYLNAATDREHTLYYAKILKDDLPLAVDLMGDILQHSIFDEEELERERMVILQEIAQANDTPDDIVFDYFQETAFPNTPLGRPILGLEETIQYFTREHFQQFMQSHYSGNRMVLAASGNIQHNELVALAEKAFTSLPPFIAAEKEQATYQGGACFKKRDLEQVQLVMGLKGMSYHDPDHYALQILSTLFGGGMSSRLFQEVREKRGLAYSIQSFTSSYADTGLFAIYAGTSQEHVPLLTSVLCDELLKLTSHITDEEMKRARAQLRAGILMGQESSSFRAEELVRNHLALKRHISVEELLEKIDAVTKADLTRIAETLLTSSTPTLTALGPIEGMEDFDTITKRLRG